MLLPAAADLSMCMCLLNGLPFFRKRRDTVHTQHKFAFNAVCLARRPLETTRTHSSMSRVQIPCGAVCALLREQVTASMDAPPPLPARLTALSQLCDAADNNDDVRLFPTLGPAYR